MAKIDHLGIEVSSIKQASRVYQALGLTVLEEKQEDEGIRSVMIPLGESQLRLIEPVNQDHRQGLQHLALHVDDISTAFDQLRQAGIRLLSEEIEIGANGRLHFMIDPADAQGLHLEICQDPITAI